METAEAVVAAQAEIAAHGGGSDGDANDTVRLELVQVPDLRERDFGKAEGAKFGVALAAAGAESREQMRRRAEKFVLGHLTLLLNQEGAGGCIVVVSHGLILDSLLRVLLERFALRGTARLGDAKTTAWSNTGYVELAVGLTVEVGTDDPVVAGGLDTVQVPGEVSGDRTPAPPALPLPPRRQPWISLSVVGVNVLTHLEGLKKTRGGIGSAQHDKRQRTMDAFFAPAMKKARVEQEPEKA